MWNPDRIVMEFQGIIFTDSVKLASKYCCGRSEVLNILQDFMGQSEAFGHHWLLLDAVEYQKELGRDPGWFDYNEVVSDFKMGMGLASGPSLCLFIIGGDDVIPIPMIADPYGTSRGLMPTDMAYCFSGLFLADLMDGPERVLSEEYVRNNVSRLPLEDGQMGTSLQDDLQSYFNICSLYEEGGIPVDGVVMTANADWIPASITMSHHLPLIYDSRKPEVIEKGMYVSPELMADDPDTQVTYLPEIEKAGMLVFNLHGADARGYSGFYSTDEVFSIGMMKMSNARVFNTVACFGARYHGYSRDDSMLLSSLFGGGKLLYCGSLIPVPMIADEDQDVPPGTHMNSGSGSEKLMPIFCLYQFMGIPAGQAMLQAKMDYFNSFRGIERDDFSLATAMMFNLYGNPMLSVKPDQKVVAAARERFVFPDAPDSSQRFTEPLRLKTKKRLVTNWSDTESSILSDVRGLVDANLNYIRGVIERELYDRFNLPPRTLVTIDGFTQKNASGGQEEGYVFTYQDKEKVFDNLTIVEAGKNGEILRVVKTK